MAGMKLQKGDIFSNHLQQKSYSLGLLLSFFLFSIFWSFFFLTPKKMNINQHLQRQGMLSYFIYLYIFEISMMQLAIGYRLNERHKLHST